MLHRLDLRHRAGGLVGLLALRIAHCTAFATAIVDTSYVAEAPARGALAWDRTEAQRSRAAGAAK